MRYKAAHRTIRPTGAYRSAPLNQIDKLEFEKIIPYLLFHISFFAVHGCFFRLKQCNHRTS